MKNGKVALVIVPEYAFGFVHQTTLWFMKLSLHHFVKVYFSLCYTCVQFFDLIWWVQRITNYFWILIHRVNNSGTWIMSVRLRLLLQKRRKKEIHCSSWENLPAFHKKKRISKRYEKVWHAFFFSCTIVQITLLPLRFLLIPY